MNVNTEIALHRRCYFGNRCEKPFKNDNFSFFTISVVNDPHKAPSRPVWLDEKAGKPTSPYLKESLRKLNEISEQTDYMYANHIETLDELYANREGLEKEMDALTARRTKLQNKIRRAAPDEKKALRQEKSEVTAQIIQIRKQLKCSCGIEERSAGIQDTPDRITASTTLPLHIELVRQIGIC